MSKYLVALFALVGCGTEDGFAYRTRHDIDVHCVDGALCFEQEVVETFTEALIQTIGGRGALQDLRVHFTPAQLRLGNKEVGGYYRTGEHRVWLRTWDSEAPYQPYGLVHELLHAVQWRRDKRTDYEHASWQWGFEKLIEAGARETLSRQSEQP